MQPKTDVIRVSPGTRFRSFLQTHQRWVRAAGSGLAGYVMANCFLFGAVSPFGVALCAALEGADAMAAAAGAVLGYLLTFSVTANLKYMAALALVVCAKWLFGGRAKERWGAIPSVVACLVCLGVCSISALLLDNPTPYDAILAVAELFLGCGATYFFARALEALPMGFSAGRAELSCIAISACIVLMGLTPVTIKGLSMGRCLGVFLILMGARHRQEAGGAICGTAAGISVGLAGGGYGYVMGAYTLGGLAAGIFGRVGRVATAAAFIIINTVVALLSMDYAGANNAIFEVFAASLIFVAIPDRLTARIPNRRAIPAQEGDSQMVLAERLEDVSGALREIGSTTRAVSDKLLEKKDTGISSVSTRVAERVCAPCGMKTNCWQLRHSVVQTALDDSLSILRKDGMISREQLPRHFQQHCCRMDEMTAELNAQFGAYLARDGVQRKVARVRAVLTDQFEGLAEMLEELAGELCSSQPLEPRQADRVKEYFARLGIAPHRLSCTLDRFSRVTVELVVPGYQAAKLSKAQVALDLCSLLEAEFDLPEIIRREKLTTFLFREKAIYTVELGAYQLASGGNRLCGDAYDIIRNHRGCAHLILSDGMGSGGSAAVDSTMTCELLNRLVSVGISYEAALKLVNSALLVKSGEESLSTVDVCTLDLFSGKARFYKAGAAPTFLLKGGKAGSLESASLPAGILHGVSFERSSVTLHEGDVVVMVSDGVTSTGADWVRSELSASQELDMQHLSEKLAVTAKMRRNDGRDDDITVVAAALRRT